MKTLRWPFLFLVLLAGITVVTFEFVARAGYTCNTECRPLSMFWVQGWSDPDCLEYDLGDCANCVAYACTDRLFPVDGTCKETADYLYFRYLDCKPVCGYSNGWIVECEFEKDLGSSWTKTRKQKYCVD